MAMTHDYMDYLNETIDIAPANSQEELQAAQVIADLMAQHDVNPQIEEFDAASLSNIVTAIISVLTFVGILVAGFGVSVLRVVGFILAIIPAVLAVLRFFGIDLTGSLGSAKSQNVIAVHKATGPMVEKGNRPIVVVAHYDSPNENFLYASSLGSYLPIISKAAPYCSYAVAVCALLQLITPLPGVVRAFFWIVGIVCSLPALLIGVATIAERFMSCTLGANDNKAAVASMLGVLENVRPSGAVPKPRPKPRPKPAPAAEPESVRVVEPAEREGADSPDEDIEVAEAEPQVVEVVGERHGEEIIRALGILPESCEIEYVSIDMPVEPMPSAEPQEPAEPMQEAASDAQPTSELEPLDDVAESTASFSLVTDLDDTASINPTGVSADSTANMDDEYAQERAELISSGRFSLVMEESEGVGEKDTSGLYATEGSYDLDSTQPRTHVPKAKPAAPDDPEWGKSNYRPQGNNFARRATLFDLPDPSDRESDPFGEGTGDGGVRQSSQPATSSAASGQEPVPPLDSQFDLLGSSSAMESVATVSASEEVASNDEEYEQEEEKRFSFKRFFDRFRRHDDEPEEEELEEGYDDEDENGDFSWRGGAATRSGLRFVDEDEAPSDEELREAVLSLGDDALICHDIWFVALGSSAKGHSGMKAFLAEHRKDIRGAFIINLDCIGAGNLTILTEEGLENPRKANRRLVRMLSSTASDLHVDVLQKSYDWNSTDATPAMKSSMRAVTLMGVGEDGLPALSRSAQDVPENVDGDQAALVTEVVTELIRRS